MRSTRAQLSIEALVTFSAFLAFLLVLLSAFLALNTRAEKLGEEFSARSCSFQTAELASYYGLDGLHSYFPLKVRDSVQVGDEVHCTRGNSTSKSKILVIENEKEPV